MKGIAFSRRLYAVILAFAVTLLPWMGDGSSICVFAAETASGTCGDNVTWVLDDSGTLTISGTGAMKDYSPSSSGKAPWYSNRSSITQVIIESDVTSVGTYAFYECSNLISVTIQYGVASIGSGAFSYCSSLANITIPDSVTTIGQSAFYRCENLTSMTIPDGVTSIGSYAFDRCSGLTSITIPSSVTA